MKRLSIFLSAIAALSLASCMDSGYDDVQKDNTGASFDTTNIVSIQRSRSAIAPSSTIVV